MAKQKSSVKIGKNVVGLFFGCTTFIGMLSLVISAVKYKTSGAIGGAIVIGVISAFLLIYNGIKIHRKRQYAAYEAAMKAADASNSYGYSKPKSQPKPQPKSKPSTSSGKNYDFIDAIQRGRYYDEFAFAGRYGKAELYVGVDYKNDEYIIQPEIEISYNKYTVKTQSDVDAYDNIVLSAYEKQFNQMVRICKDWNVSYDIREPKVTTNIHNGEIL